MKVLSSLVLVSVALAASALAQQPTAHPADALRKRNQDATSPKVSPLPGQNSCIVSAERASETGGGAASSILSECYAAQSTGSLASAQSASGGGATSDSLSLGSVVSAMSSSFRSVTSSATDASMGDSDSNASTMASASSSAPVASASSGTGNAASAGARPWSIFANMAQIAARFRGEL